MPRNEDKLGALWINEKKDGSKYMSGEIEVDGQTLKVVVLKNNYKKESKHPDYEVLRKKQQGEGSGQPQGSKQEQAVKETFQDDIPF